MPKSKKRVKKVKKSAPKSRKNIAKTKVQPEQKENSALKDASHNQSESISNDMPLTPGYLEKMTTPKFNKGRRTVIDTFIDDWSGKPKTVMKSIFWTTLFMGAYFFVTIEPYELFEWLTVVALTGGSQGLLIIAAMLLKHRRKYKQKVLEARKERLEQERNMAEEANVEQTE